MQIENENTNNVCYLKNFKDTPLALWKRMWCIFYCCLFDSIMYITLNKATFIVIEIINPIIKNIKKSNI